MQFLTEAERFTHNHARSLIFLLTCVLATQYCCPVFAQNERTVASESIQSTESIIVDESTGISSIFGKKKTVKKNYASYSSIPSSIYYEEFIDGNWWGGTLKWQSSEKVAGTDIFKATFTGRIYKK